jgi:hypothetical protein
MNVLESLKIKNSTVLNLKDNDILLIQVDENTSYQEMIDMEKNLIEVMNAKGLNNIGLWITSNVKDVKIIRR